jgi:hypothetical protein
MDLYNKYKINGPIQIVRLEGKINDIKKVIYIFGDVHTDPQYQVECIDTKSLDIHQFLAMAFEQIDHKIDLFVEIGDRDSTYYNTIRKEMYLIQMRKFLAKNFIVPINERVMTSDNYENVRFHYFDIRKTNFPGLTQDLGGFRFQLMVNHYDVYDLRQLITDAIQESIVLLNDLTSNQKMIEKLKHRYGNDEPKKVLSNLTDNYIKMLEEFPINMTKLLNDLNKVAEKIDSYDKKETNEYVKDITLKIVNILQKYNSDFWELCIRLSDIYLLRRILDKDYINTSLVYCGQAHLEDMCYILVEKFDFKITHVCHKNESIELINSKIKKIGNYNHKKIQTIIRPYINNFYNREQCSDLFDFPSGFK